MALQETVASGDTEAAAERCRGGLDRRRGRKPRSSLLTDQCHDAVTTRLTF